LRMFRSLIKILKRVLIVFLGSYLFVQAFLFVVSIYDPATYEEVAAEQEKKELARQAERAERERQKQDEERQKAEDEKTASELEFISFPTNNLEEKLNIVSSYDDVIYFSCPSMRVTKAAACGRARELDVLGASHCGEGYRTGEDLGDYFVVLSKSDTDEDYQRYIITKVRKGSGSIYSDGGKPRDKTDTVSGTSAYELGLTKLDRRSLELSERSSVRRFAIPQKYGIVDAFYVTYSYEAQTKCSPVGEGSSITDLINDASLRRKEAEEQRLQLEQEKKERLIREKEEREQSIKSKNKI